MTQPKNQDYKLTYRPTPPRYFAKYVSPLPMTGNPTEAKDEKNWERRAAIIYDQMIAEKQGDAYVPNKQRVGLWFHAVA